METETDYACRILFCFTGKNYVPSGIRCVAYNNQSNRLAVSRTDGTVEIYNLSANYFQEKVSHLGA